MLQRMLPLAIVLPILATGAIACSKNLGRPNRADAQTQLDQTVSPQETEEFRKLLVDYYTAWSIPTNKSWNIAMAEKFYQRNDRMFGFDFNPPAEGFQGWEAYEHELTMIMSNYPKFTVTLGDRFLVYRNGNVVWTVSTFNITGTLKNGSPIAGSGRNTLVWERVGDQWLIAHEHVSTPLVPSSK
jgi:ketosteroid isomerase-like protein